MPLVTATLPNPSNTPELLVFQLATGRITFVDVSSFQVPPGAPFVTFMNRFVPACVTPPRPGTGLPITVIEPLASNWLVQLNPGGKVGSVMVVKTPP